MKGLVADPRISYPVWVNKKDAQCVMMSPAPHWSVRGSRLPPTHVGSSRNVTLLDLSTIKVALMARIPSACRAEEEKLDGEEGVLGGYIP
jgi:hypothetical protein